MFKCWLLKDKVNAYAIGELDAKYTESLEQHLKDCRKCRQEVGEIRKITETVSSGEQPFLGEVFWRKFDERLDLNLASESRTRKPLVDWFVLRPMHKAVLATAIAACALLVFLLIPFKDSGIGNKSFRLAENDIVETVLLVEDETELNMGSDEDAYVEEVLLQLELNDA